MTNEFTGAGDRWMPKDPPIPLPPKAQAELDREMSRIKAEFGARRWPVALQFDESEHGDHEREKR